MTTALYRRYRPDSFEDVIGQEHVTEPLMTALTKDRISHAYLFSGPRGCGKTTSARVLARCLNCAEGPTPKPCGVCDSCQELATGGPGALDVIEIDAASHGGVDDARDLRERATYAPVRDRYKIFIIDEAHMVTSAGFNALLKIVEEPPPHIKFIFATTEPDKVIGTIRSRTHHYPFRLVPPEPLMDYLGRLCVQEDVDVEPGVLSLVIRSGGGSVRDTLSVLDQLMAGAAEGGIGYDLAVNLLGYTPGALLDDVVDAVAAADSQTVFRVVDRVVQSGQDPRRFVEDLLERFRDLVIVRAMPDAASSVLHGTPEDQVRRLEAQAAQLGAGEISRAADITNHALTEMVGATSPRLHLELLMARLMLPSSDATERGLAARLDRIERRLNYGGAPDAGPSALGAGAPGARGPGAGGVGVPAAGGAGAGGVDGAGARGLADAAEVTAGDGESGASSGSAPGLSGAALARAAMKRNESAPASLAGDAAGSPREPEQSPASGASPDMAGTEAPAPEAPRPQAAPSADWGGGWGVMPDPEPQRPEPATAGAPAERAEPDTSTAHPSTAARSTAGPSTSGPSTANHSAVGPSAAGPSTSAPSTGDPSTPGAPSEEQSSAARSTTGREPADQSRPDPQTRPESSPEPSPKTAEARTEQPTDRQPGSRASSEGEASVEALAGQPSAADRGEPSRSRAQQDQPAASTSQVEMIRRAWPEILGHLEENSRLVWMLVSQNASVAGFDGQLLTIGFSGDGPRDTVQRRGGDQVIAQAVHAVLGIQPQLDLITGGSAPAGGPGPKAEGRPAPAAPQPDATRPDATRPDATRPDAARPDAVDAGEEPAFQDDDNAPESADALPGIQNSAADAAPHRAPADRRDPGIARERPASTRPVSESHAGPSGHSGVEQQPPEDDSLGSAETLTRSEPVEEGATGPGTLPPPEDLDADSVPISDWYGEEPHDDGFPPPPDRDEDEPADDGAHARAWGSSPARRPRPGTNPSPGPSGIVRPAPDTGSASGLDNGNGNGNGNIPRPEPGRGGIPSFARPEAELRAEFEAQRSGRGSVASAASAPDAGSPERAPGADGSTPYHRRASRFQQMMEQYQRTQKGAPPPIPGQPAAPDGQAETGARGAGAADSAPPSSGHGPGAPGMADGRGSDGAGRPEPSRSVDWSDDVPSEDDVTIEESGLAGRPVVERLLGARLVEERMLDGSPLS